MPPQTQALGSTAASDEVIPTPPPKTPSLPDRFDDDADAYTEEQGESAPLLVPPPPQTQTGPGTDEPVDIEERLELRRGVNAARRGDTLLGLIALVS